MIAADVEVFVTEFRPLGHFLSTEPYADAEAVSADGRVVVGFSRGPNGLFQGFYWTEQTGLVDIGDLPGGQYRSLARGVSGDGSVITGIATPDNDSEAFRWTPDGGITGLGRFQDEESSAGEAVSDDGAVIVGGARRSDGEEATRWTARNGIEALSDLPGGEIRSSAHAVSSDGSVIVGYGFIEDPAGRSVARACQWANNLPPASLGVLPGGNESQALGVSADGRIIVGRSASAASSRRAFVWTDATGMVELPDDSASDRSTALDLSDNGRVIVGEHQIGGPVIWIDGRRLRIDRLLEGQGFDLDDISVGDVCAVSGDGRTIVGTGVFDGVIQPWRMVVEYAACSTDWDRNGLINAADVGVFLSDYFMSLSQGGLDGDYDQSGFVNSADVGAFLSDYFVHSLDPDCSFP